MKIVIFNGQPGSGKDQACEFAVLGEDHLATHFSFKHRLINITLSIFGIDWWSWDSRYQDRVLKEQPWDRLNGLTQRQALITVSEEMIKPIFGKDFFGKAAVDYIHEDIEMSKDVGAEIPDLYVCSDGGFNEEIVPLCEAFGAENIYIVRIERDGCSWEGDSRNWITSDEVPDNNYITIFNNGTLEEFKEEVIDTIDYIMKR